MVDAISSAKPIIRLATVKDLDEIHRLAANYLYSHETDLDHGFLISLMTPEQYHQAFQHTKEASDNAHQNAPFTIVRYIDNILSAIRFNPPSVKRPNTVLVVAEDRISGAIRGFLYGYNAEYAKKQFYDSKMSKTGDPASSSDEAIINLLGDGASYYILKQVVSAERGIGRQLLKFFWSTIHDIDNDCEYVFSAIVAEPQNKAAVAFHRRIGFVRVLESISKNINNKDEEYPSEVLFRPWNPNFFGDWAKLLVESKIDNDKQGEPNHDAVRTEIAALQTNMNAASNLYQHEDNLNWKKLSICITILLSILVGLWGINKDYDTSSTRSATIALVATNIVLIIAGFAILQIAKTMIRSGMDFMSKHKRATRVIEARLRMMVPSFIPVVGNVPSLSDTIRSIEIIIIGSVYLWIFVAVAGLFYMVTVFHFN